MGGLAAHIASGLLCTLPALGAVAGESLWLLLPHTNSAKVAGRSQIVRLYGGLCGLHHMNVVDGWMSLVIMIPQIVGLWMFSSPMASLITNICIASSGPFLMLIGVFMSLLPPMGGVDASTGIVFAVFGAVLGGNLAWRSIDPTFNMPTKYAPVVAGWHLVCTIIFFVYGVHFTKYVEKLKFSITLEKMKDDAVTDGATFALGDAFPTGFTADPKIVAAADKEQAAVPRTPLWRFLLEVVVLLSGLVAASTAMAGSEDSGTDYSALMYLSLVLSIASVSYVIYVNKVATAGGFGTGAVLEFKALLRPPSSRGACCV
jgi:uncharacterized protein YggT (Ycf19 family)